MGGDARAWLTQCVSAARPFCERSYELQVRRDAQGRGLGRWLLAQMEQTARLASMECVLLTTFIGTLPAPPAPSFTCALRR